MFGQATLRKRFEILRPARLLHDLVELLVAVEGEAPDAEIAIGAHDGAARLDRVHEEQLRAFDRRQALDLDQRGHVEGADAGLDQSLDDLGRVVGLGGVQHTAREIGDEPVCRAERSMRPQR